MILSAAIMDELKDKSQNRLRLILGVIILILIVLLASRFIAKETPTPSPELTEPTGAFPPASETNPLPSGLGGEPSQVINPFTGQPME